MTQKTPRQSWMATLARASRSEIETLLGVPPDHDLLKAPETGTVMVEGRAGGAGRRFNLGEATVTRCVVRLANGRMGFSYALGRDGRKARLAALLDARLQDEAEGSGLHQGIATLAARQAAARDLASRKAAATKVDFFTLVRGS
ncbi:MULTISPECIES: phosphonate C-P lyase system protein PhnG [unclassified Bosea (in: a-proteobacteria)]|uniref:phosphonate C-P lyase system protein PhnG n=1 Tax=unclassified Bosea (in: a-proteobacteria) TaxID=2653178 RepID=UPI0009599F60|nr:MULTISPECIES: phosphonate C-P lyase system protein PhnG [unclassified Bosea (in: a-proteobacteria)]OJV05024.1 MAG: phosphonate C-P lyase system protein PhnG [Bosea sp. 67-29]